MSCILTHSHIFCEIPMRQCGENEVAKGLWPSFHQKVTHHFLCDYDLHLSCRWPYCYHVTYELTLGSLPPLFPFLYKGMGCSGGENPGNHSCWCCNSQIKKLCLSCLQLLGFSSVYLNPVQTSLALFFCSTINVASRICSSLHPHRVGLRDGLPQVCDTLWQVSCLHGHLLRDGVRWRGSPFVWGRLSRCWQTGALSQQLGLWGGSFLHPYGQRWRRLWEKLHKSKLSKLS